MNSYFIIELETGVFLGSGKGDPGRTLNFSAAKRFKRRKTAMNALNEARKFGRKFEHAKIIIFELDDWMATTAGSRNRNKLNEEV